MDLHSVKYIKSIEELDKYPGYIIGGPKMTDADYSYLEKPEYKQQLKERFKNTHFMHNDLLRLCKRIKETNVAEYLAAG